MLGRKVDRRGLEVGQLEQLEADPDRVGVRAASRSSPARNLTRPDPASSARNAGAGPGSASSCSPRAPAVAAHSGAQGALLASGGLVCYAGRVRLRSLLLAGLVALGSACGPDPEPELGDICDAIAARAADLGASCSTWACPDAGQGCQVTIAFRCYLGTESAGRSGLEQCRADLGAETCTGLLAGLPASCEDLIGD